MKKDSVQMDVESKAAHQEGDAKQAEDTTQKKSPNPETNGSANDVPKHNSRQKRGQSRSRSQTPQKKVEDSKTLHVTLKKLDTELNGKDIEEEKGKSDVKGNEKVEKNETKEEKPAKEESVNVEKEKEKTTPKQKEEKPKKEEAKKTPQEKKEEAKKGTPHEKKEEAKKVSPHEKKEKKKVESAKKDTPKKDKKEKRKAETAGPKETDTEAVEMDPLVISDEPDPELQFDETSDGESGKGSPVIPRCITRRSQTRNIPTPKTPKSVEQDTESEKTSATHTPTTDVDNDIDAPKTDSLDSSEYMDSLNISMKVEVGSDATRMDYIEHHNSNLEDSSYINASREKSLSETLRGLSARRSIRPLDDYRRRVLRSNQEKSDLNMAYSSRDSVEQIVTGIKRKSRSITPEDRKKFKADSPGANSLFASPFANIRNKFKTDLPSSTPKLLSYRDSNSRLRYNDDHFENGDDEKKSWCSIM